MTQTPQYKSEAFAAIHETMDALHQIGAIDKRTRRDFDATCLTPAVAMKPSEIRTLRERSCPTRVCSLSERFAQSCFRLGAWC